MRLAVFPDNVSASKKSGKPGADQVAEAGRHKPEQGSAQYIAEEMAAEINPAVAHCNRKEYKQKCVTLTLYEQGGYSGKAYNVGGMVGYKAPRSSFAVRSAHKIPDPEIVTRPETVKIRLYDIVPDFVGDKKSHKACQHNQSTHKPVVEILTPSHLESSSGKYVKENNYIDGDKAPFVGKEQHDTIPKIGMPAVYGNRNLSVQINQIVYHTLCSVSQIRSFNS